VGRFAERLPAARLSAVFDQLFAVLLALGISPTLAVHGSRFIVQGVH
jgi:hypothetical protein